MKAIKIEIILEDNDSTKYFITEILPRLKKEHKFKQVWFSSCEYFEK